MFTFILFTSFGMMGRWFLFGFAWHFAVVLDGMIKGCDGVVSFLVVVPFLYQSHFLLL